MKNLRDLNAQHEAEETQEAARRWVDSPRPLRTLLPEGGHLPDSTHWLERYYAGERMVREKKPCVFDHLRSYGPWMVSVDEPPMSVLDGMSQTATIPAGFSPDAVVAAYFDGAFGDTSIHAGDTSLTDSPHAEGFRRVLRAHLSPALAHISFAGSGAEANEKALAVCRRDARSAEADRVLAFEGSFHGRTLLTLHATYNPKKRGPFEFSGYEAIFAPFPVWETPLEPEPPDPEDYRELLSDGRVDTLIARYAEADDALLLRELAALSAVDEALRTGQCFACLIEPMQSEGGDRYATGRFFRGLRLLTRHHKVPLIFDEVQTGFGLGGPFFWHSRFDLVDRDGQADHPDAVTMAKRAQLGVCASRFHDPAPTAAHAASMVRGRIHAELIGDGSHARTVESLVRPHLQRLHERFGELVGSPRACGYALAFDLPSPQHLSRYLAQRFWRGAVVFGAGSRTVRYRLGEGWDPPEVDQLFETIEASLAWLRDHPDETPPAWHDRPVVEAARRELPPVRLREVGPDEGEAVLETILQVEERIYEPARRDPEDRLRLAIETPGGVALVAEVEQDGNWELAGYAFAAPLERVPELDGPDRDPLRGRRNVLYSIATSVRPRFRGLGLGTRLKEMQIRVAQERRRADGSPRYAFIVGRNRVGATDVMTRLNRRYGAYALEVLDNQYGEDDAQALYYRIPIGPPAPNVEGRVHEDPLPGLLDIRVDLADGLAAPFGPGPESLGAAEASGLLFGPTVNKITICNYVSPAIVRAVETVGALAPELPHLYLTSSRDETVDKALRILRWARPGGQRVIGLEGGYVGHTTAAARSISDPAVHRQGPAHFDWPRIPHPAQVGTAASLDALRSVIEAVAEPDAVLGLVIEAVQERTGRVPPADFWTQLDTLRRAVGFPVVVAETASACFRSGLGAFASTALGFVPDLLIWWGGGQSGFIHVTAPYHVAQPLTMVSTWDGDELSLVRVDHHLRNAHGLDLTGALAAMKQVDQRLDERGLASHGLGLYRVVSGPDAPELADELADRGILCRELPNQAIALVPRLDRAEPDLERLIRCLDDLPPRSPDAHD